MSLALLKLFEFRRNIRLQEQKFVLSFKKTFSRITLLLCAAAFQVEGATPTTSSNR